MRIYIGGVLDGCGLLTTRVFPRWKIAAACVRTYARRLDFIAIVALEVMLFFAGLGWVFCCGICLQVRGSLLAAILFFKHECELAPPSCVTCLLHCRRTRSVRPFLCLFQHQPYCSVLLPVLPTRVILGHVRTFRTDCAAWSVCMYVQYSTESKYYLS